MVGETGRGESGEASMAVGPGKRPVSPHQAVCTALLPLCCGTSDRGDDNDDWHVYEIARDAAAVRVGVMHRLEASHALHSAAAPAYVVDLVWSPAALQARTGHGAWLLTHVYDRRHSLDWDVAPGQDGLTWRMTPRYAPRWLRERERTVMARLRGSLPLLGDDPLAVATDGAPVYLDALAATLGEQERERATVSFTPRDRLAAPVYVVKLRWRRLTLRPYRGFGFWLIDSVARLKGLP